MAHRGLSDDKLANRLEVARETVTRWRGQQHRLNPDKIAALASALDCEPMELWRPPDKRSIDAIVADAPDNIRAAIVDFALKVRGA